MKKILFIAFIATGLIANAQEAPKPAAKTDAKATKQDGPDATTRATNNTEKMTTALSLTADQKPKVMAINLEKAKAMDANNKKNGADAKAFETEKTRIITKWDTDLKAVLTPDQITKMKKIEADRASKQNAKPNEVQAK